jgi:transcriptional regulator with XRE-family HTH domain
MKSSLPFDDTVSSPLRSIDSIALTTRRLELGLSRADLAARAGVTTRMIFFYEEGRHTPTPARLARLAAALGCGIDALTGGRREGETLVDLRYGAGLTLERAAEALRSTGVGEELRLSGVKLSAIENGRVVRGRGWDQPEVIGRLVVALGKVYHVPVRMALDSWMRSRPSEPAPLVAELRRSEPTTAAVAAWGGLNERQRIYLGEIMRDDRMTETEMWMRRLQGLPVPRAAQWRRLPLALDVAPSVAGYTRLQERLRQHGVHDPGAGPTIHALQRRGLVRVSRDIVDVPGIGSVDRVVVEITRAGRAAARAGLGEPLGVSTPAHLLSEWLWGVLVRVASAEPEGLPDDHLAGRSLFFLGVGYRARTAGQPSRGFVDSVPVMAPGGTHVAEYRWRLTPLGRRHVREYLETYSELYPAVDLSGIDSHLLSADRPDTP